MATITKGLLGTILIMSVVAVVTVPAVFSQEMDSFGEQKGTPSVTAVPRTMTYQGILKDSGGNPVVNTTVNVTFRIFDDEFLGNLEWEQSVSITTDDNAYFSATLDNLNIPFEEDYWLELQVIGDPDPMLPRQKMNMSAYAARADTSDHAAAAVYSDSTGAITDGGVDLADIGQNGATVGQIMKWNGSTWVVADDEIGAGSGWVDDGNYVRLETSSDSVGIGTSTPTEKLEVDGNILVNGKATIGLTNTNIGVDAFVAGVDNYVSGDGTVISGGQNNLASSPLSAIGGGFYNLANAAYSFVGGGLDNIAGDTASTVGGGSYNFARGVYSVVAGGGGPAIEDSNSAYGAYSSVGGGSENVATGIFSSVCGGWRNKASEMDAFVGGGMINTASGIVSAVGGGNSNTADGYVSFVGGGSANNASNMYSSVVGGVANSADGQYSFIGGGSDNLAGDSASTVSGGFNNSATGRESTIAGGIQNMATGSNSFIGGGGYNRARGIFSVVGGGGGGTPADSNSANGYYTTVAGGASNIASASYASVGGGYHNTASNLASYAAGYYNTASGNSSLAIGGNVNTVANSFSVITGGTNNLVSGQYSFILGGNTNTISGNYSMAFGHTVNVDVSDRVVFFNQFYPGIVNINRDAAAGWSPHPFRVGVSSSNGNGAYLTSGGVWTSTSSKSKKENFQRLDSEQLLSAIEDMPVESWSYKGSDEKHIGPYAEDFVAAFDVGVVRESDGRRDDQYLAATDVAGVALAAVKELLKENKEFKQAIEDMRREIAELKANR